MDRDDVLKYFSEAVAVENGSVEKQRHAMRRVYYGVLRDYLSACCVQEIYDTLHKIITHEYYSVLNVDRLNFRDEFRRVLFNMFERDFYALDKRTVIYNLMMTRDDLDRKTKMNVTIYHVVSRYGEHFDNCVMKRLLRDVCRDMLYKKNEYVVFSSDFEELYSRYK